MNSLRIQPHVSLERLTYGALLTLAFALGCGETPPPRMPTFPASGQVLYANGSPLPSGIVIFISKANPSLNISAPIGADGAFQLQTIQGNHSEAGAIEGECEVMVTLPIVGGKAPETVTLPKPFVIGPNENRFVIRLDRNP